MKKDYTKSGFLSFAITIWALVCAVFVGFFPNFSWLMLFAILVPIIASILFNNYYNRSGLVLCRVPRGSTPLVKLLKTNKAPTKTLHKTRPDLL